MQTNQQEEEQEVCSICLDSLPKLAFVRMECCGKGLHKKCYDNIFKSSMSHKLKNQCIMCRTARPKSAEEQTERVRRWAEKGKAWAQCALGEKYRDGVGVEQSYQQAKELFDLAASQGNASAQYNLGFMYRKGLSVDQSDERAAEYYEAAARQGDADAQFNLGLLYANGQGVEQSYEEAREWWMKSAAQGVDMAIKGLQLLDKQEGRTTPSFIPKPIECANCYQPHDPSEHKLRPCARCHRVYYCGRECQVEHWKAKVNGHKKRCNKKSK